ncbi:MAG: hypothetical protein AAGF71_12900 [Pseudomonadota bacterium]
MSWIVASPTLRSSRLPWAFGNTAAWPEWLEEIGSVLESGRSELTGYRLEDFVEGVHAAAKRGADFDEIRRTFRWHCILPMIVETKKGAGPLHPDDLIENAISAAYDARGDILPPSGRTVAQHSFSVILIWAAEGNHSAGAQAAIDACCAFAPEGKAIATRNEAFVRVFVVICALLRDDKTAATEHSKSRV